MPAETEQKLLAAYIADHSEQAFRGLVEFQKQASRALGKLEKILRRRGVVATAGGLASILLAESAKAAPAGIASSLSGGAIAGASSITTSSLITNAIHTMTYAKTKIAILTAAAAAVPIGVQMNSIGDLKQEVEKYEQRETEFVERGQRLAALEEKIASLPAEMQEQLVVTANGRPVSDRRLANSGTGTGGKESRPLKSIAASPKKKTARDGSEEALVEDDDGAPIDPLAGLAGLGGFEEMMKDPAMRKMVEKQMKVQLEVTYGSFLDYLDLDDDKREQLVAALHQRQMAMTDIGIAGMKTEGGEIDLEGVGETMTTITEEYEAKLKAMMGEEKYAEFDRYEKSTAERQELGTFRESLEDNGQELTFETEQQLMAIMYEENNSIEHLSASDSIEPGDFNPENFSKQAGAAMLEDERATQERIRKRVAGVLSPEQLKVFASNQASHLRLLETGLKMQSNLFSEDE